MNASDLKYFDGHGGSRRTTSFHDAVPLRFSGAPGLPLAGTVKFVGVPNFEHGTLCRAFGLDPVRFRTDPSESAKRIGSSSGLSRNSKSRIDGLVWMHGVDRPVARFSEIRPGDKVDDLDPTSERDFQNLGRQW